MPWTAEGALHCTGLHRYVISVKYANDMRHNHTLQSMGKGMGMSRLFWAVYCLQFCVLWAVK